jgi:4-amino-4-deoxy-L-arabinose transferase-like glycosyltransferase
LLLLQYALAANSLVRENPTVDEVVHLPAGITYWQTGTFKLYHHNPPLFKLVAALPVILSHPTTAPMYRSSLWKPEYPAPASIGQLFMALNMDRFFELMTRARLLMPLFAVLGGIIVFAWSRRLYGDKGGVLSLVLWTFCPNILAHGRLVTSDMCATAVGAGATYLFWRFLHERTLPRVIGAGLGLGLAALAKFSLLVLYVLWPLLWVVFELATPGKETRPRRILQAAVHGLAICALSLLVINAGYGFEGIGHPLGQFPFASGTLTVPGKTAHGDTGNLLLDESWKRRVNRFDGSWLGALPVPLPSHFLLGFDEQKVEADGVPQQWLDPKFPDPNKITGYSVYLDGKLQRSGWSDYYLRCLLYKVPEGTWAVWIASAILLFASPRSRACWPDELVLIVMPASVILSMTLLTNINLGLRYVLPMFPYLFISCGKLARWADGLAGAARWFGWSAILLAIGTSLAATASIHPSYLAYFNWASGGPDRRPARLIDSNLDWGQDLVGLREWVRAHPRSQPIGLAYFGQIPPWIFVARNDGFEWFLPPVRPGTIAPMDARWPHEPLRTRITPGIYAISATFVYGLPFRVDDPSPKSVPATWRSRENAWGYFQLLEPFGRIGHSILLYDVTPQQAERLNRVLEPQ